MRYNKRFQTFIICSLLVMIVFSSLSASSQPVTLPPAPPATPTAQQINYAQRESTAPPAIKNRLADLRAQIQARNLRFQVGYTTAMDYSIEQLTGLIMPADFGRRAKEQNARARQLRRLDDVARDTYVREKNIKLPEFKIPATISSKTFDWRTLHKVTPVRNQAPCGSCWAFSACAAYESNYMIRNDTTPDLSEQQVLDCSGAGTCKGGWHATVFEYLLSTGIGRDADYTAYSGNKVACSANPEHGYRAVSWGYVTDELIPGSPNGRMPTVQELKQSLLENGPLAVCLLVTSSFGSYTSGVIEPLKKAGETYSYNVTVNENGTLRSKTLTFTYQSDGSLTGLDAFGNKCYPINHGVLLVGWDDYQGAWLIKNSWGTGWGDTCGYGSERGYGWIKYNAENIGAGAAWVRAKHDLYTLSKAFYDVDKNIKPLPEPQHYRKP
jgi:hypothetical protein